MFSAPEGSSGRRTCALLCALSLLSGALLSAAPQLHERLHSDASTARHTCVVTLFALGHCSASPLASSIAPLVAPDSGNPLPLRGGAAFAFFRVSSVLEHAPPARA